MNNTVCFNDILGQSFSGRTVGGIIASIVGGILAGAGVLSGNVPLALAGVGIMSLGGGIAVYDTSQYDPCASAEKLYEEMTTPEKYDRENSPNDTSTDEIDKLYPQDGPPVQQEEEGGQA